MDEFLLNYDADELRIAAEFLSNWLPFLLPGLCKTCRQIQSDRIRSLGPENTTTSNQRIVNPHQCADVHVNCSTHSSGSGSRKDSVDDNDKADTFSLGSWKDEAEGLSEHAVEESSTSKVNSSAPLARSRVKKSWADIAQEDELAEDELISIFEDTNDHSRDGTPNFTVPKVELSRDQRENIRVGSVKVTKDFICFERVSGKFVNIVDGLELHAGVFSAAEQMRIVRYTEQLQEMGRKGRLKGRTYFEPQNLIKGKGYTALQFGCCYNFSTDKSGNPPGILRNEIVDPLPHLFKVMIKRLVRWHILPPTCVPDSCIVNIFEEGDSTSPHIESFDFVRPFCTVSFLREMEIIFGSNLKVESAGESSGSFPIPIPVGSVLVLKGNGANLAKHSVPTVPSKRISITFRKMDKSKRPIGYAPEADLQDLRPLPNERVRSRKNIASRSQRSFRMPEIGREEGDREQGQSGGLLDGRPSGRIRQGPVNWRKS